jgi:hypothetical protein
MLLSRPRPKCFDAFRVDRADLAGISQPKRGQHARGPEQVTTRIYPDPLQRSKPDPLGFENLRRLLLEFRISRRPVVDLLKLRDPTLNRFSSLLQLRTWGSVKFRLEFVAPIEEPHEELPALRPLPNRPFPCDLLEHRREPPAVRQFSIQQLALEREGEFLVNNA